MSNAPDSQPPSPLSADDLSALDPDPAPAINIGSDDEAIRKISRRTSNVGRVAFLLIILCVGGLGAAWYMRDQKAQSEMAELERINALEDQSQVAPALRELLPQLVDPDHKALAIRVLGMRYKDEQSVPLFIQALDEPGIVRRDAAQALAAIGLPAAESAKQKLLDVLPTTDVIDRAAVVWALAVLRESRAADAIIEEFSRGGLQDKEGFDPRIITEVLGPERLGSEQLITHRSEPVRRLTALALAESGTPDVVGPLGRLLTAELALPQEVPEGQPEDTPVQSVEVIRAAAAGLGRTGEAAAAQPLFALLEAQPSMRAVVIDGLRKSSGASALANLIGQARDAGVKLELVRLLAETHDPSSADTLAGLLEDPDNDIKAEAAYALAELGDRRATAKLLELAQNPDTIDEALLGLKRLGDPASVEGLVALLTSNPGRKADILRALGRTGDQNVSRYLEPELEGDDAGAAALALADLGSETGYRKLLTIIPRPANVEMGATNAGERAISNDALIAKRRAAITAVGQFARPDAAEALMRIVEDPLDDYELRSRAAAALGQVATPEHLAAVIAKVQDPTVDETIRRYYLQALWQKPQPSLNPQLMQLIASDAPSEIRRAASLAVGYSADPAQDQALMTMLDNEATRREAAFAITLGGSAEAAAKLAETLGADRDTAEVLNTSLQSDELAWFDLLTQGMVESGEIWRRLEVARALGSAPDRTRQPALWVKVLAVLHSGWEGPGGVTRAQARELLYTALTGEDAARRDLAARVLIDLGERGLLIRARDSNGNGAEEARAALRGALRAEQQEDMLGAPAG